MLAVLVLLGQTAVAQTPMSAIDWLSETITEQPEAEPSTGIVADGVGTGSVTVRPLDAPSPDAAGLLPPSLTGLPSNLWGSGESARIAALMAGTATASLPAITKLRREILLAETTPPSDSDGSLLIARIDALLEIGALEEARALIEQAGTGTPALFRRWFDVTLLTGTESAACDALRESGNFAPTYQARIFCLARNGDWNAAVLTLNSADVLEAIEPDEYALIARFLDPHEYEADPVPPHPAMPSPLVFRMYEAIGESYDTRTLPRAFAHADLRPITGWKARLEAAERLARADAIPPNLLLGVYSERTPPASGGVWERVEALQRFDQALGRRDLDTAAQELPRLWNLMRRAGLEHVLATLYAPRLADFAKSEHARDTAFKLALVSTDSKDLSWRFGIATDPRDAFLKALAAGRPATAFLSEPQAQAVRDGFDNGPLAFEYRFMLREGRLGEAILTAARDFTAGLDGDLEMIAQALRLFRSVGLEDMARQAALQFLILDRVA